MPEVRSLASRLICVRRRLEPNLLLIATALTLSIIIAYALTVRKAVPVYVRKAQSVFAGEVRDEGGISSRPASLTSGTTRLTQLSDIFICLRTCGAFHESRVRFQLGTWVPLAKDSIHIYTDTDDSMLIQAAKGVEVVNTHCPSTHARRDLICKFAMEFNAFLRSGKRWFCQVDDDMYLNVNNLVILLRAFHHESDWYLGRNISPLKKRDPKNKERYLPIYFAGGAFGFCISQGLANKMKPYAGNASLLEWSDRTGLVEDVLIGYIVQYLINKTITQMSTFNGHRVSFSFLNDSNIGQQVTFGYRFNHKENNTISVQGSAAFNITNDPTRFLTAHCLMFPDTHECDAYRV